MGEILEIVRALSRDMPAAIRELQSEVNTMPLDLLDTDFLAPDVSPIRFSGLTGNIPGLGPDAKDFLAFINFRSQLRRNRMVRSRKAKDEIIKDEAKKPNDKQEKPE
jgi:hypothetical protein